MENSEAIIKLISSLSSSIDEIEMKLESTDHLVTKTLNDKLNEINKTLSDETPIEKAKLYNLYAYVISSLYFVYLKSTGLKKIENHPLKQELDRVKSYIQRTAKIESGEEEKQETRRVNTEVMQRMIKNQLGGEPAVSKVHFQGKLTKFESDEKPESKLLYDKETLDKVRDAVNKKSSKFKDKSKSRSNQSKGVAKK